MALATFLRYPTCGIIRQGHVTYKPAIKPYILHGHSTRIIQHKVSRSVHTLQKTGVTQILLTKLQTLLKGCRGKREYAQKRLPFEIDGRVKKDTLIFSYKNDRMFRYMTLFGFVQTAFWGNLAYFMVTAGQQLVSDESKFKMDSFYGQVIKFFKNNSERIAFALIAMGLLVMFTAIFYPYRTVTKLTLLRGGTNVELTTYASFGTKRTFQKPLEELSFKQGRTSPGSSLSMKIKGQYLYYQFDKREGVFHHNNMFDYVVGLQRKW